LPRWKHTGLRFPFDRAQQLAWPGAEYRERSPGKGPREKPERGWIASLRSGVDSALDSYELDCLTLPETHFPKAFDLLAFVPYFALKAAGSAFRSVQQALAALMVACT